MGLTGPANGGFQAWRSRPQVPAVDPFRNFERSAAAPQSSRSMSLRPSTVVGAGLSPNTHMSAIAVAVPIRSVPVLASNTVITSSLLLKPRSEGFVR